MTGRRAAIGLSLLCALAFSVIAVSGASAATGTTAVTCKKKPAKGGQGFSREHCKDSDISTDSEYEHVTISAGTATAIEATNKNNGAATATTVEPVLKAKIAGVAATLKGTGMATAGSITNVVGPPMKVTGKFTITFTGVKLTAGPKGCKVVGETINTTELSGESLKETMEVEFKPPASGTFTEFSLESCEQAANNGPYKVTGTAKASWDGATLETTEASTAGLKLAGQAATFTSVSTVRMTGVEGNPIGATTTE